MKTVFMILILTQSNLLFKDGVTDNEALCKGLAKEYIEYEEVAAVYCMPIHFGRDLDFDD